MYRQAVLVSIVSLFTACVAAPAPTADMSGFSGYAFGAEYEFILKDMHSESRVPEELNEKAQWYAGVLDGYPVEFAFVFENRLLVSGMWVFQDTSSKSFQSIEDLLLRTYSSSVVRAVEDGVMSYEHHGPDARIIHLLDSREPRHAVHYYFADAVAEQAAQH